MEIFGIEGTELGSTTGDRRSSASGHLSLGMRIAKIQASHIDSKQQLDQGDVEFWKKRVAELEEKVRTSARSEADTYLLPS